jgi:amidophosphoribosyltransferase
VALAHNGNLTNSAELRDLVEGRLEGDTHRGELARGNTTDTALVTALLADHPDRTLEASALDVLPRLRGAFCFVFMDEHTLYAARDPHGIRPLSSAGSNAAGSSPRRRPPSTSSVPPSCARSSPAR